MVARRQHPLLLPGSCLLNAVLAILLLTQPHCDDDAVATVAALRGALAEQRLQAAAGPGADAAGVSPGLASYRETAARRLGDADLQRLLETPAEQLRTEELLKRLAEMAAYNMVLEEQAIAAKRAKGEGGGAAADVGETVPAEQQYQEQPHSGNLDDHASNELADARRAADAAAAEAALLAAAAEEKPAPGAAVAVAEADDEDTSDARNADALSRTEQLIAARHECRDRGYATETLQRGEYWVLVNFVRAEHGRLRCFETVTYTTHADYTFLSNLQPLLEKWQAPVSIALYTPGSDLERTVAAIRHVRDCGASSALVRQFATFHVYWPAAHLPARMPNASEVARIQSDCQRPAPFAPAADGSEPRSVYREQKKLLYPVNVGRNVARDAAMTHFVLASDIELYPSAGLARQFLEMVAHGRDDEKNKQGGGKQPHVWPLVLFEVAGDQRVPRTKTDVQRMLANGTAVTFHKRVCASCHGVPRMEQWIAAPETKALGVFHTGKRTGAQHHWEPIFIGTNAEPHYEERLSWEGMSDKMTHGYAMCALDYEFRILDNAFLVHRPGIKVYHEDKRRAALQAKTNRMIREVINKELKLVYGWRKGCTL